MVKPERVGNPHVLPTQGVFCHFPLIAPSKGVPFIKQQIEDPTGGDSLTVTRGAFAICGGGILLPRSPRAPSLSQMARTAVATSDSRGVPSE